MDLVWDAWYYAEAVLLPELATRETEVFAASAIIAVLLFAVLLRCLWTWGGRRRGRHICLLGLSDSGKTLLFMRLTRGHFMRTLCSIKENKAPYVPARKNSSPVELVDVPGDERLRENIFAKYRNSLRSLVVVVDSVSMTQQMRNLAELLCDLLSERPIHRGTVPLLVLCNKQDLALAWSCTAIKTDLEKEITSVRLSRRARLEAIEGGKDKNTVSFLGKKGSNFQFSDLPCHVEFVGCSGRGHGEEDTSEGDIAALREWLDTHC